MVKVKNVLLIDDDPISNVITKALIYESNVTERILTAQNGQEALSILKNCATSDNFPDVIFLDLKMPVMDGYEFLKEMKSMGESKIVILSNPFNVKILSLKRISMWLIFLSNPYH